LEPGFQPIQGSIRNLVIRTPSGGLHRLKDEERLDDFGRVWREGGMPLTGDRTIPTACEFTITLPPKEHFVSISGTARVLLPTKVEGFSWTPGDSRTQPTKELAGCQITLKEWDKDRLNIAVKPTMHENPEPGREYAGRAWMFLSDDAGRTFNNESFDLFGMGSFEGLGSDDWHRNSRFHRVCVVRPLVAEVIEFDFEIKDIPLPRKRDD